MLAENCVNPNMVREIQKNEERLYACEACGFLYKESSRAEKCQKYCKKYNACSVEITSHAIQPD